MQVQLTMPLSNDQFLARINTDHTSGTASIQNLTLTEMHQKLTKPVVQESYKQTHRLKIQFSLNLVSILPKDTK